MRNAATPHQSPQSVSADDDLAYAGAARLGELLAAGQVTPRELTEFYLARIERLNPIVEAFVSTRAERALEEADAALRRLQAGERGPLLGVPVAIKDNVDLAGEVTTHGRADATRSARSDSEAVRRLRAAGAVVLGKTALCELAAWGHFTSSAHGITRNPWKLERSPGGSSGGSAAAVASGMAPIALGSDGGGSIRIPSAFCGLFGLKPQRGRIPLAPLSDHWHGCTVLGGLGRSVLDVALFDDVLADARLLAPAAMSEAPRLKIAISVKPAIPGVKPSEQAIRAVEHTAELLRSLGHELAECELSHPQLLVTYTPRWAAGIRAEALMLEDGSLSRRSRRMVALGRRLGGRMLRRSLACEAAAAERLNRVFEQFDLVLTPATAAPPPAAEISRDAGVLRTFNHGSPFVCYTPTWNYLGQPAATIPAGFDPDGLPRAVQLGGPAHSETTIVSLAAQIEAAAGWGRERPTELNNNHQKEPTS